MYASRTEQLPPPKEKLIPARARDTFALELGEFFRYARKEINPLLQSTEIGWDDAPPFALRESFLVEV